MVAATIPQGPRGGRLLGNMREFNSDSLGFIERCAREFGDVVATRFLYVPALFLFHPDHIEYVLAAGSKNFIKAASLRSPFFQRLVGNGLVTSEGDFWRRQRRLAQPAFHRDRVEAYARTMVAYAERMLGHWRDGQTLDAHEEMMALTRVVVAQTLFSADVSGGDSREIGDALSRLVRPFAEQATLKWILDNRLPTPAHLRFNRDVRKIDRFVYRLIEERRAARRGHGRPALDAPRRAGRGRERHDGQTAPRRADDHLPRRPRDDGAGADVGVVPARAEPGGGGEARGRVGGGVWRAGRRPWRTCRGCVTPTGS